MSNTEEQTVAPWWTPFQGPLRTLQTGLCMRYITAIIIPAWNPTTTYVKLTQLRSHPLTHVCPLPTLYLVRGISLGKQRKQKKT